MIRTFGLVQNGISLVSFGSLLVHFSPWAVAILLLAGLPAFIAEAKFSGDAFSLFRWRSPDMRMQLYLETVLARDEHAKEVKLYSLGDRFLDRYQSIFKKMYTADRALAIRRDTWGFALGLIATVALYGAYAWIALSAVHMLITLGQMTMCVMLFRQGQAAVTASLSAVGGMYEDNLYLSTLYEYLETDVRPPLGDAKRGPHPEDGVRFENVGFSYPGATEPALEGVTLHLKPGSSLALVGENGSGKTTLIAAHPTLLTDHRPHFAGRSRPAAVGRSGASRARRRDFSGLHPLPDAGPARASARATNRISKTKGAGARLRTKARPANSSRRYRRNTPRSSANGSRMAASCRAASGRKIALSRAFMRTRADILVLDEPSSPRWMRRRKRMSSSASGSWPRTASPS